MISAPEDYGLSKVQTLAHQCADAPPKRFGPFWQRFREELCTLNPRVTWPHEPGEHVIELRSVRDVRVMARITIPGEPVRGAVVTTHGYVAADMFTSEPTAWTNRPLLVVELRVRGFPPSVRDIDDLRHTWIMHGIEDPEAWILRGAVADVAHICRCVHHQLAPDQPLTLHGESFGGGLAVMAASQLASLNEPIDRLVIGLPTFGDWSWRADHYCNGAGGQVNAAIEMCRGADRNRFIDNLVLFDAAIHARAVIAPALCKLAELDVVVPAPTAAAVFNGLATPAHQKLIFTTRYGHYDGGLADLRRHALFERLHPRFADPSKDNDEFVEDLRHVQESLSQALRANGPCRTAG